MLCSPRDDSQTVRPLQVLVGPNGSGKSSFLDGIGVLGDVLRVGPLRAIAGDSPNGVAQRAADPSHLSWMRKGANLELAVELLIPAALSGKVRERFKRARRDRPRGRPGRRTRLRDALARPRRERRRPGGVTDSRRRRGDRNGASVRSPCRD